MSAPEPVCDNCGQTKQVMISRFGIVWTGPMSQRYRDPKLEGYHGPDHHWMYTRNTPDGKPKAVLIDSWQASREFAKAEGLVPPQEAPPMEISSDGKSITSVGLPHCMV